MILARYKGSYTKRLSASAYFSVGVGDLERIITCYTNWLSILCS